MKLLTRLFLFFWLIQFFSQTQVEAQKCGSHLYSTQFKKKFGATPGSERFEKWMFNNMNSPKFRIQNTAADTMLIPVVVHVIHKGENIGEGVNISNEQVFSQIEVLNEDFQRLNSDTVNTPDEFKSVAGSMNIKFILARRDPDGNATTGIVRKKGDLNEWPILSGGGISTFYDSLLKAQSYWPAETYLNIWVADIGPNIFLGYAQFPDIDLPGLEGEDTENRLTDGVTMDYTVFGSAAKGNFPDLRQQFNLGRTTTHEVGHYLGLLHVWGNFEGSCATDDYIFDTPDQRNSHNNCIDPMDPPFSCSSRDMSENYMDYTDDACMNLFSEGQIERMRIVLENSPRRTTVVNSSGTVPVTEEVYDVALVGIVYPEVAVCLDGFEPEVQVFNKGTEDVPGVIVDAYILNEDQLWELVVSASFSDTLKAGDVVNYILPEIELPEGVYDLQYRIQIDELDVNPQDNSLDQSLVANNFTDLLPYRDRFFYANWSESSWRPANPGNTYSFELVATSENNPRNKSVLYESYVNPEIGSEDLLVSPGFDFSNAFKASVVFDLSYAFNEPKSERLSLFAITDCGASKELLWSRSGLELSVEQSANYWIPSNESSWRREKIDVSSFYGQEHVRFVFEALNQNGNNIYIDNFEVYLNTPEEITDQVLEPYSFIVYPNPSVNKKLNIALSLEQRQEVQITLVDAKGAVFYQEQFANTLNQVLQVDLFDRNPGIYYVNITGQNFFKTEKIILY